MGPAGTSESVYGPCGPQRGYMTQRRHRNLRTVTDRCRSNVHPLRCRHHRQRQGARPLARTRFTCLDPRRVGSSRRIHFPTARRPYQPLPLFSCEQVDAREGEEKVWWRVRLGWQRARGRPPPPHTSLALTTPKKLTLTCQMRGQKESDHAATAADHSPTPHCQGHQPPTPSTSPQQALASAPAPSASAPLAFPSPPFFRLLAEVPAVPLAAPSTAGADGNVDGLLPLSERVRSHRNTARKWRIAQAVDRTTLIAGDKSVCRCCIS